MAQKLEASGRGREKCTPLLKLIHDTCMYNAPNDPKTIIKQESMCAGVVREMNGDNQK